MFLEVPTDAIGHLALYADTLAGMASERFVLHGAAGCARDEKVQQQAEDLLAGFEVAASKRSLNASSSASKNGRLTLCPAASFSILLHSMVAGRAQTADFRRLIGRKLPRKEARVRAKMMPACGWKMRRLPQSDACLHDYWISLSDSFCNSSSQISVHAGSVGLV